MKKSFFLVVSLIILLLFTSCGKRCKDCNFDITEGSSVTDWCNKDACSVNIAADSGKKHSHDIYCDCK